MIKPILLATTLFTITFFSFTASVCFADQDTPATSAEHQPNAWIKDNLFIYMHTGSSNKFRVQGSIEAGTPIEVSDKNDETGYVQIKDPRGRTGWIDGDNISQSPTIQQLYAKQTTELNTLKAKYEDQESTIDDLQQQLKANDNNTNIVNQRIVKLEQEKTTLLLKVKQSQLAEQKKMLIEGAGIIIAGILFGLLIPSLVRRRRQSERWA